MANIKVYAPYNNFKWQHMKFPLGFRYCDSEEIKLLKKVPIEYGEIKIADGKILNQPIKRKSTKKKVTKKSS